MEDHMNIVEKTLCSLGGADTDILSSCPKNEKRRYWMSALMNINSSLIAAAAIAVTFYFVNKTWHPIFIFLIAVFWGFISFTITASLVGSVSKTKKNFGKSTISMVGSFLIRLAISVVFSLLTSQTLEILVFRDFLPAARRKQALLAEQALQEIMKNRHDEVEVLREQLASIDLEIQEWERGRMAIFSSDPILADLIQLRTSLESRLNAVSAQHRESNRLSADRISSAQRQVASINTELNNLGSDNLSTADFQRRQELTSQRASFNAIITHENAERNRRNAEITTIEQRIAAQQNLIDERRNLLDADNRGRATVLFDRRALATTAFTEAENNLTANIDDNNRAASETYSQDNLINSLITIQFIQSLRNHPDATYEERATATKVSQIRFLIMAIFIILDLSALLIIALGKSGIYDCKKEKELEFEEIVCDIEKERKIAEKRLDVHAEMESNRQKVNSQVVYNDIENFTQQAKDFYILLNNARENAMKEVHAIEQSKFKDKLGFELLDTIKTIKEVFQNTQSRATKMFDSLQNNYQMNFLKKAS
jgi:uncharacterized membrane protein